MPKIRNDFRREVDLMSELRHGNIVCLLGVCMKQDPKKWENLSHS
jgi:receptor tyrosine kinase-like orphan receptor 1